MRYRIEIALLSLLPLLATQSLAQAAVTTLPPAAVSGNFKIAAKGIEWRQFNAGGILIRMPLGVTQEINVPLNSLNGYADSVSGQRLDETGVANSVHGRVTYDLRPSPRVAIDVFAARTADFGAGPDIDVQISTELRYTLEILGPSGRVPVTLKASGAVGSTPDARSGPSTVNYAVLAMRSALGVTSPVHSIPEVASAKRDIASAIFQDLSGSTFEFNDSLMMYTNTRYSVNLSAYIFMALAGDFTNNRTFEAHAFVDPVFTLGNIADPHLYSFVFSPGVGNEPFASGVPESATWAMMLIGFAGLGYAARRRREAVPA